VVLISSNRGLCGAFNSQVTKKIMGQIENPTLMKINRVGSRRIYSSIADEDLEYDFVAVGKKGFDYLNSRGHNVIATFEGLNYAPTADLVRPIARIVIDDYVEKKYDKVVVAYTDFKNTLVQEPKLRQLLPLSKVDLEKQIEEMSSEAEENLEEFEEEIDYKIEPDPRLVVKQILPRLVEMQLYHAILESNASKESARMLAMRNANDAASEMMQKLQYTYNQLRQMGITSEIAEITSGRVALED
jgi:F-type H+-transporting ATPase subunit gamma